MCGPILAAVTPILTALGGGSAIAGAATAATTAAAGVSAFQSIRRTNQARKAASAQLDVARQARQDALAAEGKRTEQARVAAENAKAAKAEASLGAREERFARYRTARASRGGAKAKMTSIWNTGPVAFGGPRSFFAGA
jgi:Skp family chaperone for outer membrane proteins